MNPVQHSKSGSNMHQQLQMAQHNRQILHQLQQQQQQRMMIQSGTHPLQLSSGLTLHQSSHMPLVNSPSSGNILHVRFQQAHLITSWSLSCSVRSNHQLASNLHQNLSSTKLISKRPWTTTWSSTILYLSHFHCRGQSHWRPPMSLWLEASPVSVSAWASKTLETFRRKWWR